MRGWVTRETKRDGDEGYIGSSGKLLCLWQTQKIMEHMRGNIPYLFDFWADPFVHLLLLKSSMDGMREIARGREREIANKLKSFLSIH